MDRNENKMWFELLAVPEFDVNDDDGDDDDDDAGNSICRQ